MKGRPAAPQPRCSSIELFGKAPEAGIEPALPRYERSTSCLTASKEFAENVDRRSEPRGKLRLVRRDLNPQQRVSETRARSVELRRNSSLTAAK